MCSRYGINLDSETAVTGNFTCKVDSSYVGNQNISFILNGAYGRSAADPNAVHVSADDRLYMYQTYAGIRLLRVNISTTIEICALITCLFFVSNFRSSVLLWFFC